MSHDPSSKGFPALTSDEEVDVFAALVWERVSDKLRHRLVTRLMGSDPDAERDARRKRWIPGAPVPVQSRAEHLRDEAAWCWYEAEIIEAGAKPDPELMYGDTVDALIRLAGRFMNAAQWVEEHDEGGEE